jgi:hypothetical protein
VLSLLWKRNCPMGLLTACERNPLLFLRSLRKVKALEAADTCHPGSNAMIDFMCSAFLVDECKRTGAVPSSPTVSSCLSARTGRLELSQLLSSQILWILSRKRIAVIEDAQAPVSSAKGAVENTASSIFDAFDSPSMPKAS